VTEALRCCSCEVKRMRTSNGSAILIVTGFSAARRTIYAVHEGRCK